MLKPEKLHFGTAGFPLCQVGKEYGDALEYNLKHNIQGMELEFVYGVKMKDKSIPVIKKYAEEKGMIITAHGPFYINLNSAEEDKYEASVKRILDTARMAHQCGAYSITFHAAFYQKKDPEIVYEKVKSSLSDIIKTLKSENIEIWVRPELTGKASQFGSLEELIRLSNEVEMLLPCIDFSHMHARLNGFNGYDKFAYILDKMAKEIGEHALNNFHGHVAGIEYGSKGEKKHLDLEESDFKYKDLLKALKDFNVKGIIICESPNIEKDAGMLAKNFYAK